MPELRWQDGKPSEPGWYWVDDGSDGNPAIVDIYHIRTGAKRSLYVSWTGNDIDYQIGESGIVRFAGPIQEPVSD